MPRGRPPVSNPLKSELQALVLADRHLVRVDNKLKFADARLIGVDDPNSGKTLAMVLIETLKQKPIEELLDCSQKVDVIAVNLGIQPNTVRKWRHRLSLKGGVAGRPRVRELKQKAS